MKTSKEDNIRQRRKFTDYFPKAVLYHSDQTDVIRAVRKQDDLPVIIKTRYNQSTDRINTGLKNEFEIGKSLNSKYLIRYLGFEQEKDKNFIILSDDNLKSLNQCIPQEGLGVTAFLDLSLKLAGAIEELHSNRIIHKDINPGNILVNSDFSELRLIDLEYSSISSEEHVGFEPPKVLEGTLLYMAPEQTGRVNRNIDSRSDLYSLGITFYQLITGQLPFESNNPGAVIYFQIAKTPPLVSNINYKIPVPVAGIIERLLQKSQNDRYQTIEALKQDLQFVRDRVAAGENSFDFVPGKNDTKYEIQLSQKLYGRSQEIEQLFNVFEKSRKSPQIATVNGNAGIGKTVLIRELYRPITSESGLFLTGKFDQFNNGVAYSALRDVFKEFIKQCLGQNEETINKWRDQILSSIGQFGSVLTDLVPEFEELIGRQPQIASVSPAENSARLKSVISDLIKEICSFGVPVVIFIDDLQWSDMATLALLDEGLQIGTANLLIILSYRDEEISAAHPAQLFLDKIKTQKIEFCNIHLTSLKKDSVQEWLNDILHSSVSSFDDLANIITSKTGGNPFYITSFLQLIIDRKYLEKQGDGTIHCSVEAISALSAEKNVVDHLINKIKELKPDEIEILKKLSILGNSFSFIDIEIALDLKPSDIQKNINALIAAHILMRSRNNFFFVHDRVRQSAATLLDPQETARLHLQIGRNIKKSLESEGVADECIEKYIYHFNAAADLITAENEINELLLLNITIGKRLKNNAAYQAAEDAFRMAEHFLPADPFKKCYQQAVDLFSEYGEVQFLNGKYDEGELQFEKVIAHSISPLDKAGIYIKQIVHHASHHNLEKSMNIALSALDLLRMKLPKKMLKAVVILELLKVKKLLKNKKPEDIITLPVADDPLALAQINLLGASIVPAYIGYPDYFPIVSLRMAGISLEKGNCPMSIFAWINYGVIQCSLGNFETGYRFGVSALNLLDKMESKALSTKIPYMFAFMIHHWKKPAMESEVLFQQAINNGIESGDYEFASYAANNTMHVAFYAGRNINALLEKYPEQHRILGAFNKKHTIYEARFWNQMLVTMSDPAGDGISVSGKFIDDNTLIPLLEKQKDYSSLGICRIARMQLAYMAGDYVMAEKTRKHALELLSALTGTVFIPVCHFFNALTCIAHYRKHKTNKGLLKDARNSLKKLQKWGKSAPDNYLAKAKLVEAELTSFSGKMANVLRLYEEAIDSAEKAGNNLDHGLGCELMGRYLLAGGLESSGYAQIHKSISVFEQWGALNKAHRLAKEFSVDIQDIQSVAEENLSISQSISSKHFYEKLDLELLVKSISSFTTDLEFSSLLTNLLDVIQKSSGATRILFIDVKENNLFVRAEKTGDDDVLIISTGDNSLEAFQLSVSHIRQCYLKNKDYLLANINTDDLSEPISYDRKNAISALIIPLIRKGHIIGMIYLENKLMSDAFRKAHIRFLRLLSVQAAIAFENAKIFKNLNEERNYSYNIIQNSQSMICGIDNTGSTVFVNPVISKITGYSENELIGSNWWELFFPGDEYSQVERFFENLGENVVAEYEMILTCKNGNKKSTIWNFFCKHDADNKLVEIIGFGNDVTEQKQAEEQIRALKNYLYNVINSMPSVLIGIDKNSVVTHWNKEAQHQTKISHEESIGQPVLKVYPQLAMETARIRQAIEKRAVQINPKQQRQHNGELIYEDITIYPLIANGVEGAVIRVDDVTEQVQLEEMMVQSEKMLSVGGLAAGMAHEINNPLAGMMQTADVLATRLTNMEMLANIKAAETVGIDMEQIAAFMEKRAIPRMVGTIRKSGRRVAEIVDNMLSFARKSDSQVSSHNPAELMDKTLLLAATDYDLKKKQDFKTICIEKNYEPDLPYIPCEGAKIQQVLLNIFRNGAQAMQEAAPDGEHCFYLGLSHEKEKGMVRFEIRDNGPGMDEETRKRVFEPFFTTKPVGVGTGLGLSVSYFIITENHSGEMAVKSTPGAGATFIIRLPVSLKKEGL